MRTQQTQDTVKIEKSKSPFRLVSILPLPKNPEHQNDPYRIPKGPKFLRLFQHTFTGQVYSSTDLASQLQKRNNALRQFAATYKAKHINRRNGKLSLISVIANIANYPDINKLIRPLKTRLKRHQIPLKGYFWLRDVGDYEFVPHYHLLLVIKREDENRFNKLCIKYKNMVKIQSQRTCGIANNYLKKKAAYAKPRQRLFGASKTFEI